MRVEMTFYAHTLGRSAICPCCGRKSSSVKAYRLRKLQDVEFLGSHMTLILEARLFRCRNKNCRKVSFAEPLKVAKPYAHMTNDASRRVEYASLNQSARLASSTLAMQNIRVSNSTCNRKAGWLGEMNPDVRSSGYIGVDDWAFRKGRTYMCSIVDHYTGEVLAVFDGRYPGDLVLWLRSHHEVKLVTRDGSREVHKTQKRRDMALHQDRPDHERETDEAEDDTPAGGQGHWRMLKLQMHDCRRRRLPRSG